VTVTIVMPCLNEAETLGKYIEKARLGVERSGVRGEILLADNGKDDSVRIAEQLGARVVHVKEKGYGNALRGGIQAASGKWIIMGDADESYDFSESDRFVKKFQQGFELVAGIADAFALLGTQYWPYAATKYLFPQGAQHHAVSNHVVCFVDAKRGPFKE
jgi:glycosyltransferase involved in cell wall biosynthesis